jgi:hypothetical protein
MAFSQTAERRTKSGETLSLYIILQRRRKTKRNPPPVISTTKVIHQGLTCKKSERLLRPPPPPRTQIKSYEPVVQPCISIYGGIKIVIRRNLDLLPLVNTKGRRKTLLCTTRHYFITRSAALWRKMHLFQLQRLFLSHCCSQRDNIGCWREINLFSEKPSIC